MAEINLYTLLIKLAHTHAHAYSTQLRTFYADAVIYLFIAAAGPLNSRARWPEKKEFSVPVRCSSYHFIL